jgi:5'(3')-deoxyribonucleotidase
MIKEKLILYVDMDGVLCDYDKAHKKALKETPKIKYPQSVEGFFLNLEPIPDAIKVMGWIIKSEYFDVWILTAPSVYNPLSYMEKRLWVEKWFGMDMAHKLIESPNKGLNKGDFLIDDNVDGKGQENFEGEVIQFGSRYFKDWKEIAIYLNKQ